MRRTQPISMRSIRTRNAPYSASSCRSSSPSTVAVPSNNWCGSSSPAASGYCSTTSSSTKIFGILETAKLTETEWSRNFAEANKAAGKSLAQRDTAGVLSIVLSRLYTLRNHLYDGG